MTLLQSNPVPTLEEFLKLPETKPASEYIDGKIYHKPMPKGKHSTLQIEVAMAEDGKITLADYKNIVAWVARVRKLPGYIDLPKI